MYLQLLLEGEALSSRVDTGREEESERRAKLFRADLRPTAAA